MTAVAELIVTFETETHHRVADVMSDHRAEDDLILFYDGVCALCAWSVQFVLDHERKPVLKFSPLQGETAAKLLPADLTQNLNSVILRTPDGVYQKTSAVVRVLWAMGGKWKVLGSLLWLIPRPIRDLGYKVFAANRYRLFGKHESCRLPRPGEMARTLP